MNIFKNFTLKWWQGAFFKWGIFLLGIAVGASYSTFFSANIPALLIISAGFLSYISYIWWKQ